MANACITRMLRHFEETGGTLLEKTKGEILFEDSEPVSGILFVKSGRVQLKVNCPIGADIVRTAKRGDMLGVAPLFCGKAHHLVAEVVSKAKVLFVDSPSFLAYLDANPDTRLHVLEMLSAEVSSCYEMIRSTLSPRSPHDH